MMIYERRYTADDSTRGLVHRIFKYPIERIDLQVIEGPALCPISAAIDPLGQLCVWGSVETPNPTFIGAGDHRREVTARDRRWEIYVVGTGNPASHVVGYGCRFLGSVVDAPFVWHIYARDPDFDPNANRATMD